MRIKCIISYDGADYFGYQAQEGLVTIESMLDNALYKIFLEHIKIYASGRTDRGVHAIGQVIHFDTTKKINPNGLLKALNSYLKEDIRVLSCTEVDDNFHARFSVKEKEYHYLIKTNNYTVFDRRYMAHYYNLSLPLMKEAIKKYIGTHNFKGLCSGSVDPRKDFVKTIYEAYIEEEGDILRFVFKGTGFLKYQIRRMMGLLVEIGLGKKNIDIIDKVFETKDNKISHLSVGSEGLYLVKVVY